MLLKKWRLVSRTGDEFFLKGKRTMLQHFPLITY